MAARHPDDRYDPWLDLATNWPAIEVAVVPMAGTLLGELCYPVIALRAGTSSAQRRCTLAHELVHLERGTGECGPFAGREEALVHAEVAQRLVSTTDLLAAVRALGARHDLSALADALDVDVQTLQVRLGLLRGAERSAVRSITAGPLWRIA
jgi:hypothetical protein